MVNLKGIPNYKTYNKRQRLDRSVKQEIYFINVLNNSQKDIKYVRTADYFPNYSTLIDLQEGDVIGLNNNVITDYIDLKVADIGTDLNCCASITLNSILFFKKENHYYVCTNADGSKCKEYESEIVKEFFNNTNKCLRISKNTERTNEEYLLKNSQYSNLEEELKKKYKGKPPVQVSLLDYITCDQIEEYLYLKKMGIN